MKSLLFLICLSSGLYAAAISNPNFEQLYFSGSGLCADCHNDLSTAQGEDISIETLWSPSMMANSSRDPYWQAKVASELKRDADRGGQLNAIIHDKCSRCHMPMANDSAAKQGQAILIFDQGNAIGFLNPNHAEFDAAMDGVSCTLCHQIQNSLQFGSLEARSGHYQIGDYLVEGIAREDRPIYGQYNGVSTAPMRNNVAFTPQLGDHIQQSELCASCHDLKTPFVDAQGNVIPQSLAEEFPEQMVYSEWAFSDYQNQKSCQDCHMPKLDEAVLIANRPFNLSPRNGFALHTMRGANTVMMDLLNRNRVDLGVLADPVDFERAIIDNRSFLQQAARLELLNMEWLNGQLHFQIKVINQTGHKLPSGYPARRVYLYVQLQDQAGQILFESGALNADGSIVGVDADEDFNRFEPHYTVIRSADQVQVYEPIMADSEGQLTHTLLRAADYLKDNRLLPIGFDKANAPSDIAVHGQALNDSDFIGGSDVVNYQIDLPSPPAWIGMRVELRYQSLNYAHLQNLFTDNDQVPVAAFQTYFEQNQTIRVENIAELQQEIRLFDLLDFDANAQINVQDGLFFLRSALQIHQFDDLVAVDCNRCSVTVIDDYIHSLGLQLDIDGNGQVEALTDGLLFWRWSMGIRGDDLVRGALAADCQRCDAETIRLYLDSL